MKEREGYDGPALEAMWRSYRTDQPIEQLQDRAAKALSFWAVYDGEEPAGAVFFEADPRLDAPALHVGFVQPGRAGFVIRRLVRMALERWGRVYAPVSASNVPVCRLAEGLGFELLAERNGARLYRRQT